MQPGRAASRRSMAAKSLQRNIKAAPGLAGERGPERGRTSMGLGLALTGLPHASGFEGHPGLLAEHARPPGDRVPGSSMSFRCGFRAPAAIDRRARACANGTVPAPSFDPRRRRQAAESIAQARTAAIVAQMRSRAPDRLGACDAARGTLVVFRSRGGANEWPRSRCCPGVGARRLILGDLLAQRAAGRLDDLEVLP